MDKKVVNKKKFIIIIAIILSVLFIAAGTYALWIWNSTINKNVVMNTITGIGKEIIYNEGESKIKDGFKPTSNFCEAEYTTISFYKSGSLTHIAVNAVINMQLKSIGDNLKSSSDVYWILTSGNNESVSNCSDGLNSSSILSYGNFNNVSTDTSIELLTNINVLNEPQEFTLWLWIDSSAENLDSFFGETIDVDLWTQFEVLEQIKYVVNFDTNGGEMDYTHLVQSYNRSGNYSFSAPEDSEYLIELWGASGGADTLSDGSNKSGKGGYTSGFLSLEKGERLYFFVGGKGLHNATAANVGGYNGGGYSGNNTSYNSYSGGGSTDVRLVNGLWNDSLGLNSRIMVAAGGAGTIVNSKITTQAGHGGGLTGGDATTTVSDYNSSTYLAKGSNQTKPSTTKGNAGFAYETTKRQGSFGYSIQSHPSGYGGGGGGGYYGGGTGYGSTGAGGSSYISGHTGCVAIASSTSTAARTGTNSASCSTGSTDNLCSVHYSGKVFTNTTMIDGGGFLWTTKKETQSKMPNPASGFYNYGEGKNGDGAAKISIKNAFLAIPNRKYGITLPTPTREGFVFKGWYTEEGTLVTKNTKFVVNDEGYVNTLYARWEEESYNVTFDNQGGEILLFSESTKNSSSNPYYTFTAPRNGKYRLEVWGAQGGKSYTVAGGYGGYSTGVVDLKSNEILYVYIGGQGTEGSESSSATSRAGGYNGGGNGSRSSGTKYYVAGGGGATDIRYFPNTSNLSADDLLWNSEMGLNSRIIVAGGGGGVAYLDSDSKTTSKGHGGGAAGRTAKGYDSNGNPYEADGGVQTGIGSAGSTNGGAASFGKGGTRGTSGTPGGGGGWYGGNSNTYAAGGGSGYIGSSFLKDKVMYCYDCWESNNVDTLTISVTNVDDVATSRYAKEGDGAAKISLVAHKVNIGGTYGELPTPTKSGYTFDGWNTMSDGTGTTVNSATVVSSNVTLYAQWK